MAHSRGDTDMQPFQARVVAEKRDLDERIGKLRFFLTEQKVVELSPEERERLVRQEGLMEQYSAVLAERIAAFGPLDVTVTVNGKIIKIADPTLAYEDLVKLAGYPAGSNPTCTYGYVGEQNRGGILSAGQALQVVGNEYFSVVNTGNA